jgi:PAS domain S-box-containing protein
MTVPGKVDASMLPDLDLSSCEREPIHTPGAIQPHGALLAVLAEGHLVSHASANLAAICGHPAEAVLGRTLEDVLGEAMSLAVLRHAGAGDAITADCLLPGADGTTCVLQAHRSGRHVVIDIHPARATPGVAPQVTTVQSLLDTFRHAASCTELCALAVRGLKDMTGYDRVMAYRFHADGHGEVIAEAREPQVQPFLGLHYPASDIPPQARRLYLRQRTGVIADASYQPVPLLSDPALDDGMPLDLTHSTLRSASPVHREYMRNMGTAASLTIGLSHGREPGGQLLWGMLVCHHETPRLPPDGVRATAGVVGQVVSLLLGSLTEAETYAQRFARNAVLRGLLYRLGVAVSLPATLEAASAELLSLVDAGGAVVRLAGNVLWLGRTPPHDVAEQALTVLLDLAGGAVLAIDDLGLRHPELAGCTHDGAGALLLPLAPDTGDAILWFRPELPRTVVWGGNPAEHAMMDPVTRRLSPRASFAAWKQTVSGRAEPWADADVALARELRDVLLSVLARRTRAALRDTEARLERAQEIAGLGSWELDLASGDYIWSRQLHRILGVVPGFTPTRDGLAALVHPDDRALLSDWDAQRAAGLEGDAIEFRIVRPDGEVRVLRREGRPVVDPDGSHRRLAGTMQDITRQRLVERQLAEAQKMEAVGQLAGGLAHNFNNLLGVIMGNVEFLLDGMRDRAEERELAEQILKSAGQGAELTRSMLAFGRRQPLRPAVIDLNEVLSRHIALLRRVLGEAVIVTATLAPELWHPCVDPAQAVDVLSNLAINARDAMPEGGRLTIETRNVVLDAAYLATHVDVTPGEYVLLAVTDTGSGMPPEVLARATEPFFTTKGPDKGTGLGLSMCFGFARQSGGHLSLYSEVGVGTTVRLYLPRAEAALRRQPERPTPIPIPGGHEAILLVEDNDQMREMVGRTLVTLGYRLHPAADAAAALAILRSGVPIDLLLTDMVMPGGMNGVQLAQAARQQVPGLKVLFTTGFAHLDDGDAPIPPEQILQKPYRRDELATRIRTVLDGH